MQLVRYVMWNSPFSIALMDALTIGLSVLRNDMEKFPITLIHVGIIRQKRRILMSRMTQHKPVV